MKKLIVVLLTLSIFNTFASPLVPHNPWEKDIITKEIIKLPAGNMVVGNASGKASSIDPLDEGLGVQRVAVFDYDFDVDGGAISTIATGVNLPANAIIEQCWFRVETQLVDAGSGTLAVQCEDAGNIFAAADFTGNADGAIVAGAPLGTVATMVDDIAASCDISFVIAGAALTAGKLRGYCKYVAHE